MTASRAGDLAVCPVGGPAAHGRLHGVVVDYFNIYLQLAGGDEAVKHDAEVASQSSDRLCYELLMH